MTIETSPTGATAGNHAHLGPELAAHQRPDKVRAAWQLVNSVGGYLLAWVLMVFTVDISWWLTVPLAVVAGGLLVRVFIIMHDCAHGSFLGSRRVNDVVGSVCGALALTPYFRWRWEHARHHATSGNLEHRGIGDIWTMTVEEYRQSSRLRRLGYRLVRNPVCLFGVGPFWLMLAKERLPHGAPNRRAKRSVWWTNLFLLGMAALGVSVFGWLDYLILQAIIIGVAGGAGIWLFYVQHQFEDAYWVRDEEWDFADAALRGSSFYKLPKVLQWFSGNIGFHHIHHLSPRIPNYRLEKCHASTGALQQVPVLTLRGSLRTLSLRLWDEAAEKLVGYDRAA
ncbi:MAG: fatty acid desaturase [Xanthomonadales bacterium]|jgi:omega-6 fatty acid desaturase (delta-12 desaturase)|nr:fatty acid desaturase [Xanthomonadales bacterium]